jgi:MerR family copper efflux transcriptional regulator
MIDMTYRVSPTQPNPGRPETASMRIGELSRRTGLSRDTLRFYEKAGLLSPRVGRNGYRLYDASHLDLLRSIRFAQVLGFTLAEIKQSLGQWETLTPAERARFLEDKLEDIDARIGELQEMRAHLEEKIRWIRAGKVGAPEALQSAAQARKRTAHR